MNCQVKLFAAARQFAQCDQLSLDLPAKATVADLRGAIVEAQPALAQLMPSALIAINTRYARESDPIPANAEIAVIPPVSGG